MLIFDTLKTFYPDISDALLRAVLDIVEEDFIDYTRCESLPENIDGLMVMMAKERINQFGAEGFASEGVAGSSVSFLDDYSPTIYKRMNKYRHIRTPRKREE